MIAAETGRAIEQDLLQKADVIAHYLRGVSSTDGEFASRVLREVIVRLEESVVSAVQHSPPLSKVTPVLVASRSGAGDEIEEFILDNLTTSPTGLSVQEIFDRIDEAQLEMKRKTLVVRLHRMVHAGKLMSRAHGHYTLSEVEHRRRQTS